MPRLLRARKSAYSTTRRSGSLYGSGRSSTALVTLKMAVLAPMPSAMVDAAVRVTMGFLRRALAAKMSSRIIGWLPQPSMTSGEYGVGDGYRTRDLLSHSQAFCH